MWSDRGVDAGEALIADGAILREDLLANKRAAGRKKDLFDIEALGY
jgi:hypothetical protein